MKIVEKKNAPGQVTFGCLSHATCFRHPEARDRVYMKLTDVRSNTSPNCVVMYTSGSVFTLTMELNQMVIPANFALVEQDV